MSEKLPVILLLDNVRSLHNVGSLFRTADGANIEKIILTGLTPCPPRSEISKTALGATSSVDFEYFASVTEAITRYQNTHHPVALEQTEQSTDFYATSIVLPLLLVIGHERAGVSPEALRHCTQHVHLPMYGISAHSLNVSIAGSVALYELRRRSCYSR